MKHLIITAALLAGSLAAHAQEDKHGISDGKLVTMVRDFNNVTVKLEGKHTVWFTGKTIFMTSGEEIKSYVRTSDIYQGERDGKILECATYKDNDTGKEYTIEKTAINVEGTEVILMFVWLGEKAFELYAYVIEK